MKRKEIFQLIVEKGPMDIQTVFQLFNAQTKIEKKNINRVIKSFIKDGKFIYNNEKDEIRVNDSLKIHRKKSSVIDGISSKKNEDGEKVKTEKSKRYFLSEGMDLEYIKEKYKIRDHFSTSVLSEAEAIDEKIPDREIKRRTDLRDRLIVTIDGADAKDLDDAVSLEKLHNGEWLFGVHIADVSTYVNTASKLDKEALKRGNSYYFINKVTPMFPEKLSNGICSLNPDEDKLTLSLLMRLSASGEVKDYSIEETVIRSRYRLSYTSVQNFFDNKDSVEDKQLSEILINMRKLYRILYENRIKNGSIDFNFKEQKMRLDKDHNPVEVWLKDRIDSERIIEEFMLLANKTVAGFLLEKGNSIFRIHKEPSSEKIQDFVRIAMQFGHKIYGLPIPDPQELQKILKVVENKPHKDFITQILLRSMQQAQYHTDNIGHYGLGFEHYTHFTSPIRRYADLIVHRLLKNALPNNKNKTDYSLDKLEEISTHISRTERVAMEAEREFYKIKSIRFMKDKTGEVYKAIITGVTSFGIFAQIEKYGVEGLIRYHDIQNDYYIFNEGDYFVRGKRKKITYTMGDKITIKVKKVNVERGFLDLILCD